MAKVRGFDAVMISCKAEAGTLSHLKLKYLINGATQNFGVLNLRLKKDGSKWIATELASDEKVDTLNFRANRVLSVLLGVERVDINPT